MLHAVKVMELAFGSLSRDKSRASISNSEGLNHQTLLMFGFKTWQGGSGVVSKVTYSKPNYLNQYYCLYEKCPNYTFSLTISDASYKNMYGAGDIRTLPMHNSKPCRNVTILGVALLPAQG